ncbi:thermonuclease family protein [Sinorhizobium sp. A49]|uniref:thermonuclease family protein n=1 Tax=Sinorhizobium sp. A49 TaxID=1945861 RepID=UPI0009850221|nr:thermonuclease family protein [Sinorhizobium sp. A49]
MKKWFAALLAVSLSGLPVSAAEPLAGRASVVDGDTIDIGKVRVRLHGVDAPESRQLCADRNGNTYRCGREAAFALDRFLAAARPTRCELVDRDRYGRVVGVCFRADGVNVNRWLVENGHALDWPRYSKGAYAGAQRAAQVSGFGIWQGAFQKPCEVRAERTGQRVAC